MKYLHDPLDGALPIGAESKHMPALPSGQKHHDGRARSHTLFSMCPNH